MHSLFQDKIRSGSFVITAEITPPKGTDTTKAVENADMLRGCVDALNITDNNRAVMRMSPVALGKILKDRGHEVIVQMTCRDRNRLALQSELLGAYALGIENICVMTGDHVKSGDHQGAKAVYDLDSVQLLSMIRKMMNGSDLYGNPLDSAPEFMVGAVSNIDPGQAMQMLKFKKKILEGADFIQTQAIYDPDLFESFMEYAREFKVPVIAGIIPLKSAGMARFMNENVPGIHIGEDLIERMEQARDPVHEGFEISCEVISRIRPICQGIHLMPIGQHLNTQRLLEMAGFSK